MKRAFATLTAALSVAVSGCGSAQPPATAPPSVASSVASIPSALPPPTTRPFPTQSPTPSADTKGALAYQTWDGSVHLHLADADGSNDHFLVDGSHPDWSPDGSQIAYEVDSKDIYVINRDGTNPDRVFDCENPCVIGDSPAWSPDGKVLAFTTADSINGNALTGRIVAADVASGELRTLVETQGPEYPFYPRWAPDGNSIVFSIQRFNTTSVDDCMPIGSVATVDLSEDTPTPHRLTDLDMFGDYPDWSPTGDTIVFTTYDLGTRDYCTIDPAQPSDLYTIRPDGSGLTQLTHNPSGSTVIRNQTATGPLSSQPSWTPDGHSIVYVQVEGSVWPGYQVWTMNGDGTSPEQLGSGHPIVGSHPRFAP